MKIYLGNAFSLQMLDVTKETNIKVEPASAEDVAETDFESAIGHQDTANVVSALLNRKVECRRISVRLEPGDILFVAQVTGGRLPGGTAVLPDGVGIIFLKVTI